MRSTRIVLLIAVVLGLLIPTAVFAQSGPDTFKAKCAMCHGPDGKKAMPAPKFRS
jgi:cytochrome c553